MVTGNLKSKMADKGFNCKLSILTVIRGKEMSLDHLGSTLSFASKFKVEKTGEGVFRACLRGWRINFMA
jgi:CheY-specific phosphatase CheX